MCIAKVFSVLSTADLSFPEPQALSYSLQMISSKKSYVMIMLTANNSSSLTSNLVNMTGSLYFQPSWFLIISSWVQLFIHKQNWLTMTSLEYGIHLIFGPGNTNTFKKLESEYIFPIFMENKEYIYFLSCQIVHCIQIQSILEIRILCSRRESI